MSAHYLLFLAFSFLASVKITIEHGQLLLAWPVSDAEVSTAEVIQVGHLQKCPRHALGHCACA